MRLSDAQIADFHDNGYLHFAEGVLGDDDLGPVIAEYEALVDGGRGGCLPTAS